MVAPRKNIPSYIPQNLQYLRSLKGFTLDYMAGVLGLQGKTSYYAYEQGKVLPDVFKLMKLASLYDVSVEDLVYRDLSSSKPVHQPVDVKLYQVDFVPVKATAGYAHGYGDPGWLAELPTIMLPFKPYGIARAFEIKGDSMEPEIPDGSRVVAIKVDKTEIRDRSVYIVVTSEGVQCKQIRLSGDLLYLISINDRFTPQHIKKKDLKELWQAWKILKPGET